jgi:hypothetical protein
VFAHGYSFNVDGWGPHLSHSAQRDGVLAVAMNYRGLTDLPDQPATPIRTNALAAGR